jgi:hypothetical protein
MAGKERGDLVQCSCFTRLYMLYRVIYIYDLYSFVEESGSEFLGFNLCTNEGYFCNSAGLPLHQMDQMLRTTYWQWSIMLGGRWTVSFWGPWGRHPIIS